MKVITLFVFVFFSLTAKSQTAKDYIVLLTADLKQSWRLDSITMNSNYTELKKEMVVLFKLNNRAVIFYGSLQKADTIAWFLEKKEKYALLTLGEIGRYEIDFLQRNNVRYMRLRNEIPLQKNINITEYFFLPSNDKLPGKSKII
ncbi:MAG TPA: hypothetical protein VKR53_08470 [Puia sp.]|nr:hypothetical protein [Puia sp.]